MSSSVHTKVKDILILGKGPTQGLNHKLAAETKYSINFRINNFIKFCLSLHYNQSNSSLFINATKIYQFKAKDSEIKKYVLWLGNISGDFSANNMDKTELDEYVYDFSVDYRVFDASNIMDIHKYLMKKHDIKWCLELFKKCLVYY